MMLPTLRCYFISSELYSTLSTKSFFFFLRQKSYRVYMMSDSYSLGEGNWETQ